MIERNETSAPTSPLTKPKDASAPTASEEKTLEKAYLPRPVEQPKLMLLNEHDTFDKP